MEFKQCIIERVPIFVILRAGNTSGPNTSNIPEHTNSICILNVTQMETNFILIASNGVPLRTSACRRPTPETKMIMEKTCKVD